MCDTGAARSWVVWARHEPLDPARTAEVSFWAEPKKLCAHARVGWSSGTARRIRLIVHRDDDDRGLPLARKLCVQPVLAWSRGGTPLVPIRPSLLISAERDDVERDE